MIKIVNNQPLISQIEEFDVILVGTNCYQVMRNGFQYEISNKFPNVKTMNNQTKYADISKVGTILECENSSVPLIVLLYITFGYNFKGNDNEYIDYDALTKCLRLCNLLYKGKNVATTMLGCTFFDGNGDKNKVLDILNNTITNFTLTVFDYEQESYRSIKRKEFEELKNKNKF